MRFAAGASDRDTSPPRAPAAVSSLATSSLTGEQRGVTMDFTRLVTPHPAGCHTET